MEPKKPNSGHRRTLKCRIVQRHRTDRLTCKISGESCFPSAYAVILVEGGRANDTPGVTYSAIRGAAECPAEDTKKFKRSKWGKKRPNSTELKKRRKDRQYLQSLEEI